ncbi:LPS assembly lipoprotein LptE [uncultured Caulobacter sp.]|uniref:LPS assembly lipoprotein LptE n=1 Tax=uncultured Caulobacter sp. TaxID=158749 RepID=UPI00260DAB08|nr:LPS assembly lipoprotein LptE [uncultured Caulobacter sp.]
MKRILLAGALALSTTVLSACAGFTPLYARPGVEGGLSSIETEAAEGRGGYLLREQLDDAFNHHQGGPAAYKLVFAVNETRFARGVRLDNVANRYELKMSVTWKLLDAKTRAELHKGLTDVSVTYDSADQPYAAIAAQQDGQERAATEAARKIQLDLATWLAAKRPA